jgi:hypothetical protein
MNQSALIIIRGSFATRNLSRDLAVSIIESIKLSGTPVVWALNSRNREEELLSAEEDTEPVPSLPTAIDVLKQLILQVLQQNHTHLSERSGALNIARYKSATTESEWFDLLGSVITGMSRLYIVIDVEVVGPDSSDTCHWPETFARLFKTLVAKNVYSTVKVVLVSYRTRLAVEAVGAAGGTVLNLESRSRIIRSSRSSKVTKARQPVKVGRRR